MKNKLKQKTFMACAMLALGVTFSAFSDDNEKWESSKSEYESEIGDAIDLGLPSGTKWADRNVGALKPEDCGDYFAWGETAPKFDYTSSMTYAVGLSTLQSKSIIESKGNLTAKHDAATVNWGKGWHMPTLEQIKELRSKCEWTWTSRSGVNGYLVTGPNGNSIFLPAAGCRDSVSLYGAGVYGNYWCSTANEKYSSYAYSLYFFCGNDSRHGSLRSYGFSVRPVAE